MTPEPIDWNLEEIKGLQGLLEGKRQLIKSYEQLIEALERRIKTLEIENALLKQSPGRKATKKKRMKPSIRWKVRHLKLIAINGALVNGKGGAQ